MRSAWLIESDGRVNVAAAGIPCYLSINPRNEQYSGSTLGFTTDAWQAVHFASERNARDVLARCGYEKCRVTQHMFEEAA